ncbi:MAG: rhamnulokinase [Oscillospiraceae bacterium]|nr:rhamnulokinase [Oscillospiraceae bacterium]
MKYYLAIDIGASSGRHIVGWIENGVLKTEEVYRFPNGVTEENGHLVWNMKALLACVKAGIKAAFSKYPRIESLSVDTWGCDYVLMDGDKEIEPCYAYRDKRTESVVEAAHARVPFYTLYRHTGCQYQPFNTVYQLCADRLTGRLDRATDFLMVPEYLLYKLTGVKKKEYTNATTTGLVSVETREFDKTLISALQLPERLFPSLYRSGEPLGRLTPELEKELGGNCAVVLCATHDTASAVEGIPMNEWMPYISSGTWSLLGVKTPKPLTDDRSQSGNWSNEGGVGYNRYQKNIMGLWLVNRLRAELCPDKPFSEIVEDAKASRFDELVNADAELFLSPSRMKAAFDMSLETKPSRPADYFRCAYRSLALSYKYALDELERNTGKTYERLCIVGGGAKNQFLNDLTAHFTQKQVIALPIEATAIGNLKAQMEADK